MTLTMKGSFSQDKSPMKIHAGLTIGNGEAAGRTDVHRNTIFKIESSG